MKKEYFNLEIELIALQSLDVITLSTGNDDNDVTGDDPYGDF